MDPNWSWQAYNRGAAEDFHLTAAGQSAQSLLLQAAHSGIAATFNAATGGGSFVSPSPISSYNPVFQQIYHHAAAASVQPKPAHYSSSAVNTPHRQIQIPTGLDKQLNSFQNQATGAAVTAAANSSSNYYGENSSSSGASPSPTTASMTPTTLSWNSPMISNTFLAMQQQQQQQQQQQDAQALVHSQSQHQQLNIDKVQPQETDELQLQQQQQPNLEEIMTTNQLYYTIAGKNYKVVKKLNGQQENVHLEQTVSNPSSYINYTTTSTQNNVSTNCIDNSTNNIRTPSQVILFKNDNNGSINSAELQFRRTPSANSSPAMVGYSSVIQSTVQQQQQQESSNCWTKIVNNDNNDEDNKNIIQLRVKQEDRHQEFSIDSEVVDENIVFNLPAGLEIKQTLYDTGTGAQNQQPNSSIIEQQLHERQRRQFIMANKLQSINNNIQHPIRQQQQSMPPSTQSSAVLSSQIQVIQKLEEKQTPAKVTKTPRKRQPKKNVSTNDYSPGRSVLDPTTQAQLPQQQSLQQQQQLGQQHQQQQPSTYYDFNNKWNMSLKIENNTPPPVEQTTATINIPTYVTPHSALAQQQSHQHQQQQSQHPQQQQLQIPQPAHLQSSQAQSHPHLTNLSYYSAFPQQIPTQYGASCAQSTTSSTSATSISIPHTNYSQNQQQPHIQSHLQQAQSNHQTQSQQSQQQSLEQHSPLQQQQSQQQQQQSSPLQQQSNQIVSESESSVNDVANKVIVPNIEEELDFLTDAIEPKQGYANSVHHNCIQTNSVSNNTNFGIRNPNNIFANVTSTATTIGNNSVVTPMSKPLSVHSIDKRPVVVCAGTSIGEKKTQFMDSYLKFLQGDRDNSPPPVVKSGRKLSYQKSPGGGGASKRSKHNASSVSDDNRQKQTNNDTQQNTSQSGIITTDDGHQIKILSQTQILPKKRLHAQLAAAAATTSVIQHPTVQIQQQQQPLQQQQHQQESSEPSYCNQNSSQNSNAYTSIQSSCAQVGMSGNNTQDHLSVPRRELCLRKAKQSSSNMNAILLNSASIGGNANDDQLLEPDEFADSDTDPVWTPDENDDSNDEKSYKKKARGRNKATPRKNNVCLQSHQQQVHKQAELEQSLQSGQEPSSCDITNQELGTSYTNSSSTVDNFKTGDFIVLRSDLVNDWPIIWQVDSKCILQKYESFCQNGKIFYRNTSKYASWNLDTKKLYLKAPVRIQIQSHTETIVEFMRSELLADDTEQFIEKIMDDYLSYRDHFEIYIQTMISQVLDPSFFSEITREKDEYFLGSVRTIDNLMENSKRKLISITPWTRSIIGSIEIWPKCHVFTEWGQNKLSQKNCGGCHQPGPSVRFLLFGNPYNSNTMQTIPTDSRITYEKDILLCRICAARADIFHKIAHEKYNLFVSCSKRVQEQQQENRNKTSTEILNDLLAEHNWVDELFRNMRNSWAEVESLERQHRFREVTQ